jgi:chitodextrinase
VTVTLKADSGSETVNAVQASLGFDATQLQFVGFTEGGPFSLVLASDAATAGKVRIARGVPTGSPAVSGDNGVVTLKFKVLAATGSAAISFDDEASLLVRSTDSTNILSGTTGTTIAVTGNTGGNENNGRLSLEPTTVSSQKDSTFSVTLKENSGAEFVTFVQANVAYDAAKVQYVSMTEGNTFTTKAATDTATPGLIRVARGIPVGGGGVSGQNSVVTLTFKTLATSGTANVTIDKAESLLVTATGARNILGTVDNSTVTVASAPTNDGPATLSMAPATGTYAKDATVSVTVRANSGSASLSTVQAVVNYPANQLQYVNATDSATYPTAMRTNSATAGTIDVIRGIAGGAQGVTGTNPVVTLNFKVIGTGSTAAVNFASGSAAFDTSGTGANILNLASSQGANYTIASVTPPTDNCTGNPSTPGTITRAAFTYTSVSLSWPASTAAANCTLAGYHVFRNGTLLADVTNGTTFEDGGLNAGTSYNYTVQAFDTGGHTSASSASVSLSTKADDQAPNAPTGFTAVANASASIALNWTPSTDMPTPGGSGVTGYSIYRNNDTQPTYTVTGANTFTDSNVMADTTYTYTVRAVDKSGNQSAPSNIVSVKTAPPACSGAPTVPTGLTLTNTTLTSASFTWTASTATTGCEVAGYKIYRGSTLAGTVTSTNFTDNNLTPNTIYGYTVRAFDTSAHNSDPSAALTATTQADTAAPTAPASVSALATSSGQASLSWPAAQDNVGVESYKVYRNNTLLRTLPGGTRTLNDNTVSPNTDYKYEVSAVDEAGNESAKTVATPNPLRTPEASDTVAPAKVANLRKLVVTTSAISIAWDASTDNVGVTGYHVYRNGTLVGDSTTASYSDSNLTPDTAYTYTVKAFDADGNESTVSDPLQVTTVSATGDSLIGDLNNDDNVDIYDLSILLTHWQQQNVPPRQGELNGDGTVNTGDLTILLNRYGEVR